MSYIGEVYLYVSPAAILEYQFSQTINFLLENTMAIVKSCSRQISVNGSFVAVIAALTVGLFVSPANADRVVYNLGDTIPATITGDATSGDLELNAGEGTGEIIYIQERSATFPVRFPQTCMQPEPGERTAERALTFEAHFHIPAFPRWIVTYWYLRAMVQIQRLPPPGLLETEKSQLKASTAQTTEI